MASTKYGYGIEKPVYRSGNPVSIPEGLFHGQFLSFALQCDPTISSYKIVQRLYYFPDAIEKS